MSNKEKDKIRLVDIVGVGVFLLGMCVLIFFFNKKSESISKDIDDNLEVSTCRIVKYGFGGKSAAKVGIYSYEIDGENFECGFNLYGKEEYFEKECLTQGHSNCLGANFNIEYSAVNPENSRVLVGEYKWTRNIGGVRERNE